MLPLEFFESRGIRFYQKGEIRDKHINSPDFVQSTCPICGGSKLWLGYNVRDGYFNCWAHGFADKWDLFRFWFPNENIGQLIHSIEWPDGLSTYTPPQITSSSVFKEPDGIVNLLDSDQHCQYLRNRYLNPEILMRYYAVGAVVLGKYANCGRHLKSAARGI